MTAIEAMPVKEMPVTTPFVTVALAVAPLPPPPEIVTVGTPVSITFLAAHYQDAKLAAFGWAYQQATGFHKLHPKLD